MPRQKNKFRKDRPRAEGQRDHHRGTNNTASSSSGSSSRPDIEEALRLQRLQFAAESTEPHESASDGVANLSTEAVPQLRNYEYDYERQRYYKKQKSISLAPKKQNVDIRPQKPAPVVDIAIHYSRDLSHTHYLTRRRKCTSVARCLHLNDSFGYDERLWTVRRSSCPSRYNSLDFHPHAGLLILTSTGMQYRMGMRSFRVQFRKHASARFLKWCSNGPSNPLMACLVEDDILTYSNSVQELAESGSKTRICRDKEDIWSVYWSPPNRRLYMGIEKCLRSFCLPPTGAAKFVQSVGLPSIAMALCSSKCSPGHMFTGLRNGSIVSTDERVGGSNRVSALCSLPYCIDHLSLLHDEVSLLACDLTGCISLFDIRYTRQESLRIASHYKNTLQRRQFWVSRDEQMVAYSHPSTGDYSLGIYSLREPMTLLSTQSYLAHMLEDKTRNTNHETGHTGTYNFPNITDEENSRANVGGKCIYLAANNNIDYFHCDYVDSDFTTRGDPWSGLYGMVLTHDVPETVVRGETMV